MTGTHKLMFCGSFNKCADCSDENCPNNAESSSIDELWGYDGENHNEVNLIQHIGAGYWGYTETEILQMVIQ